MTVGWGIISTGRHPDVKVVPAMKLAKDTNVAAVYSRDMGRAEAFAQKHGVPNAYDSVGDLLTAESVYQVLKGSPAGAAATLDTLAKGRRAPEPEIASIPRGGTVLHQRIAIVFDGAPLDPAWAALEFTPRAHGLETAWHPFFAHGDPAHGK